MRVGLVLGAGGVLGGAWLTGALHALAEETDWDPGSAEFVVGTSAGAMIGALTASGVPPWFMVAHSAGESFDGVLARDGSPAAEADRAAGAVFRLHRGLPPLGPGSLRMAFTALANPLGHTPLQMLAGWLPSGFVSTESLRDIVCRVVPDGWVEHPNYWAVACDYRSGRRIPFGRLDSPNAHLADAVAASCAIPGFYRPVKVGSRRYVDGGVCSASNLDLVAGRGLDLVICLNPLSSGTEVARDGRGRLGRLARPARLARRAQPPGQRAAARPRGRQGASLRHRGAPDRADRDRPRGDGPQPDERRPPPAGDRDRHAHGSGTAPDARAEAPPPRPAGRRAAQGAPPLGAAVELAAAAPGRPRGVGEGGVSASP